MAPRAKDSVDELPADFGKRVLSNQELMPDAGKIPLKPADMWGKGIIKDLRSTVFTWWIKEMTNFNQRTLAVSLLMFISCIAPALSFGAIYSRVTNGYMGAIETLLGTGYVGCVYALIGGMPMSILGSTGPLMIMSTILYGLSQNLDIPFLTFNFWVFLWVMVYAIVCAFFDITRYVLLASRFTDDVFALLIVSIFVMDAIGDPFSTTGLLRYFQPTHPHHAANADVEGYDQLNVAFLSCILGFGTVYTIFMFRDFRFSPFCPNDTIRNLFADFAVIISLIIWTGVSFAFPSITLEKLKVPARFEPTFQCCDSSCDTAWPQDCEGQPEAFGARPWIVNPGDFNGKAWVMVMAAGPAILEFMLVYLDNGITWHLVNHPSNKLSHGDAYNWDLMLVGILNFINALLGLTPLVATTVPCIVHVNSLSVKDREGNILEVQETRLTGFLAHLLIALSTVALDVLRLLPLPVLYGVFLFMGLAGLGGIQLWHRFCLFFMQPCKYPDYVYVRYMEKGRIHMFTIMQFVFWGLIFFVQNYRPIAIVFPFMTLLCIPGRLFLFTKVFEGWELLLLDGDDIDIDRWIELKEQNQVAAAGIPVSTRFDGKSMDDDLESEKGANDDADAEFSV